MSYQEWLKNEANQASLRQEELIVSVTGSIIDAMDRAQLSKADLAAKLGVSRSYITQILSGNRNMTLRTLADISHAIDHGVYFSLRPRVSSFLKVSWLQDKDSYRPVWLDTQDFACADEVDAAQDSSIESPYLQAA